ncbi:methyl-accepting chemotaxis protein [Bacillus sp. Bva_UNVM-123]|uniref:HAMP domain-containing protein n=1 Tax=Bacillus sp. Bva_UNVM-123 TaxID=2829798 RepID=UPI00391F02A2
MNENTKVIVDQETQLLIANEELAKSVANRISTARGYVLYGGDYKERFNEYSKVGKENGEIITSLGNTPEFELLKKRTIDWEEFVITKVFAEYDKGNDVLARQNLAVKNQEVRDIMTGYEKRATESREKINDIGQNIMNSGQATLYVAIGLIAVVIIISIIVAIITANIITNPLNRVKERMNLIASGDFSGERLHTLLHDEIGQLIVSTNEMSSNVRNVLSEINMVSEVINGQSEELSQSANEVNAGTQQIAVTMQEMATGTETQATSASDLASIMRAFLTNVEEANTNGEQIKHASDEVLGMTVEGSQLKLAIMRLN